MGWRNEMVCIAVGMLMVNCKPFARTQWEVTKKRKVWTVDSVLA